jgi:GNAT superfamily N-acetyltransferase
VDASPVSSEYTIRRARPTDAADLVRVHLAVWRTTYRDIGGENFLDEMASQADARTRRWTERLGTPGPQAMFAAEHAAAGIVGFAEGGPLREPDPDYGGELRAIYVLREHQRHGIGRDLVAAVARYLRDQGKSDMLVWVLARNPYRRFYESLGGRAVRTKSYRMGGEPFELVGYGFRDLNSLAAPRPAARGDGPERGRASP